MNAPNVIIQRKEWINNLPKLDKNKFVFLDESGVNIDMTRIYGRSFGGSRCVDKAPLIKPQSTTILSSVRLNGETAFKTYQGGTTCERFTDYLKNVLAPTLEPDDIVVMDNMRTHHSKAVKKVIDELKINVIYLPPYSPDFNPIENMWSKIKAILRKLKVRVLSELSSAIELAFSLVFLSDCLVFCGWLVRIFLWNAIIALGFPTSD